KCHFHLRLNPEILNQQTSIVFTSQFLTILFCLLVNHDFFVGQSNCHLKGHSSHPLRGQSQYSDSSYIMSKDVSTLSGRSRESILCHRHELNSRSLCSGI